jgi:RHS repeat-associated protein
MFTTIFKIFSSIINNLAMRHIYVKLTLILSLIVSLFYSFDSKSQSSACVVNKVRLVFRGDCCLDRLQGGTIQGSNDRKTWKTLYTITVSGNGGNWQEFTFPNTTPYAYVRYVSSNNSHGELYELEFYNGSTKLTGRSFGSSGKFGYGWNNSLAAVDGNIATPWAGITLGPMNYAGLILNSCSNLSVAPNTYIVDEVRYRFRSDCCFERLNGAKIQASKDNVNWVTLYTFNTSAINPGTWQEIQLNNKVLYKYVKFVASPTGYGELFGLEFYSGLYQLKGAYFGSAGTYSGNHYTAAVDDDDYTWWHGAAPGINNFAGLNIDIPNYITQKNGGAAFAGNTTATASSGVLNYVAEKTYKQKSTSESETDITQVDINVTYLDGIGRPTHKIAVEASPNGNDIVQPIVYDNMGRSSTSYLPYTVNNEGKSIDNPSGKSEVFYNNVPAGVTGDTKTTAFTDYEKSPIGRVLSQEIIGSHFTGKKTNLSYYLNQQAGDDPVKKYIYSGDYSPSNDANLTAIAQSGNFATTQLAVNYVLYDGQESREYKDYEGRTVLKRVRLDKPGTTWLDTYYVYDDLNQLRAVIPPKLTSLSSTELNNLAYLYHYDELGRPIVKKVPGKDAEYVVYDAWDRVAFTQDGNQRASVPQKWTYVKYDKLNRAVMTGEATCSSSRATLQAAVIGVITATDRYVVRNATRPGFFETGNTYGGTLSYGSNDILSVTYYDAYDFPLPTSAAAPSGAVGSPTGFAVGSRTRILNNINAWNIAVTYYDTDFRPVKSFSSLYNIPGSLTATEAVSTNYGNFHTRVLTDLVEHLGINSGGNLKLFNRYCYDHEGRLKKSFLTITKGSKTEKEIMVNKLTYNELGQLFKKEIHQKSGAAKTMQQLEYAYHLHGGLKSSTSKFFTQSLYYDTRKSGSDGLFTDNISETYWKRKGETAEKGYTFNYDKINRLKDANGVNFNYEEKGIDYDNNGNISQLTRNWKGADMDNLTYTYDGNKLATLQDANADGSGRGVKAGTFTYAGGDYDQNGNQLKDPAKNVTNIQYNYLDLPQTVSVNGKTLTYAYDASGEKQVYQNGLTETIYYAGAAEYNTTGQLSRIATGEGMIYPSMKNGNQIFQYQYYLPDHLGNVRVLFNDRGDTLQNTDYYPYGLAITNKSLFGGQRYLYNGKEVQTETNEYDFGARFYDPSTGRWHTMDPASQMVSPYDYTGGNPINRIDPDGRFWHWEGARLIADANDNLGTLFTFLAKEGMKYSGEYLASIFNKNDAWLNAASGILEKNIKGQTFVGIVNPSASLLSKTGLAVENGLSRLTWGAVHGVEGIVEMVIHPINTLQGIKNLVTNPGVIYDKAIVAYENVKKDVNNGNYNAVIGDIGEIGGNVAAGYGSGEAANVVGKAAKAATLAKLETLGSAFDGVGELGAVGANAYTAAEASAAASDVALLKPYGGPGGGHHVPAKSAFEGAPNYDLNKALAIPNDELARLGVNHGTITGAQMKAYKAFASTGAPLTWNAITTIETNALISGGMQSSKAISTVNNAVNALKNSGVAGPTRIPWKK